MSVSSYPPKATISTTDANGLVYGASAGAIYAASAGLYLQHGLGTYPLTPFGKDPVVRWTGASVTWGQVKTWGQRFPGFNIALRTGQNSVLVIDVDPRHGGSGSLDRLVSAGLDLTGSIRYRTESGGQHILFRHPDLHLPPKVLGLWPGIDVLAGRALAVCPPSIGKLGPYLFEHDWVRPLWEIATAPAFVVAQTFLAVQQRGGPQRYIGEVKPGALVPGRAASPERQVKSPNEQARFRAIFANLGIGLWRGQRNYLCAWHDDRNPSLAVHAEMCVFFCHACGAQGGIKALEALQKAALSALCPNRSVVVGRGGGGGGGGRRRLVKIEKLEIKSNLPAEGSDEAPICPKARRLTWGDRATGELTDQVDTCRSRHCPSCGPDARQALAREFTNRALALGRPFYRRRVPDGRWAALHKEFQRKAGEYIRVPLAGRASVVFSPRPVGERLELMDLYSQLLAAIEQSREGQRITSSRALSPEP